LVINGLEVDLLRVLYPKLFVRKLYDMG